MIWITKTMRISVKRKIYQISLMNSDNILYNPSMGSVFENCASVFHYWNQPIRKSVRIFTKSSKSIRIMQRNASNPKTSAAMKYYYSMHSPAIILHLPLKIDTKLESISNKCSSTSTNLHPMMIYRRTRTILPPKIARKPKNSTSPLKTWKWKIPMPIFLSR